MAAIDEQDRQILSGVGSLQERESYSSSRTALLALHGRKAPVRERSSNADAGTEDQSQSHSLDGPHRRRDARRRCRNSRCVVPQPAMLCVTSES